MDTLYPERISTKDAPVFLASKWLHFDFLVETVEIKELFDSIEAPLYLFSTMGVQQNGKNSIAMRDFFDCWQRYIDTLKSGKSVQDSDIRFFFTACLTRDLKALRTQQLANEREVIIPYEPIVQMQLHRFSYSQTDNKFHSQAFGDESVSWGVRLSYPQLYQYPHTRVVENALDETKFINASLVPTIRAWLRKMTLPTPFIVDGVQINEPMRIGRGCFSWINNHCDLIRRQIQVKSL